MSWARDPPNSEASNAPANLPRSRRNGSAFPANLGSLSESGMLGDRGVLFCNASNNDVDDCEALGFLATLEMKRVVLVGVDARRLSGA
jgi:hypothetical protein